MRTSLATFALLLGLSLSAQQKSISPLPVLPVEARSAKAGATYAVVIGISDYQDLQIPDLRFADKDAQAFANFLYSPAGGSLDGDHLQVLTNTQATAGRIAEALDALIEKAQKDDQVIIYFSGHGDVERKTVSQPGFLLAWDAPSRVYMGGGTYSLAFLQEVVTTLSTQNLAKVTVITDACHAGKLAGSQIGGSQLTAASLAKQFSNEVKILSCQPGELSLEGEQWGGGRGIFSYHLVEGLFGLADRNGDGTVSVGEIDRYLEDKVTAEAAPQSQVPMLLGNKSERLATVNAAILADLKKSKARGLPVFAVTEGRGLEEEVLAKLDSGIIKKYWAFKKAVAEKRFLEPANNCAEAFYTSISGEPGLAPLHGYLKRNFAAALQDDSQQALNRLLKNDLIEATKSAQTKYNEYKNFPAYLTRAAQLLGESHYFYPELMARKNIFEGYLFSTQNRNYNDKSTGEKTINYYREALRWQPEHPLAYFFLGSAFCRSVVNLDSAEYYVQLATDAAPKWVLPIASLATDLSTRFRQIDRAQAWLEKGMIIDSSSALLLNAYQPIYSAQKRLDLAEKVMLKVLEIDSTRSWFYNNLASVYFEQRRAKECEWAYLKAIQLDSTNPAPFCNLGNLFLQLQNFEKSEYYYRKGIVVDSAGSLNHSGLGILFMIMNRNQDAIFYLKNALRFDSTNLSAWGSLGNIYLNNNQFSDALSMYRSVLALDSTTRNASYSLSGMGQALIGLGNLEEAISAFERSVSIDSTNIYALAGWASALMRKNDLENAERKLNQADRLAPNQWVILYNFALLHLKKGNTDLALQSLENALKTGLRDFKTLSTDSEFAPLRALPEWKILMKKYFPDQVKD